MILVTAALALAPQAAQRPNIVVVLSDDMGFSDLGCYGGEIATPRLDALAAHGLRYTQFTNAGRCCPTRASLLTGLYAHQAGIGHMTSEDVEQRFDRGYPGYRGTLSSETATLAEVLGSAGYRTYMSGKWHVGTFAGSWPIDRGFDHYAGIVRGGANYYRPAPDKLLMIDGVPFEPPDDFYITDAFTDYALDHLRDAETADDQPFFLYLAYTSPHWPLHAPDEVVERYRGRYSAGWDALRAERHARMIAAGLVDEEWPLTARDATAWKQLPAERRAVLERRMELYAAQIDRMDWNIGRLVDALQELGELENTLILFMNDNGGCAEGGEFGGGPEKELGTRAGYFLTYGRGWANASNTPFRRYKHWVHEGGIATPLIAHWPAGIAARGELRRDPGHLVDIMATCVDLAQATYPAERAGRAIPPAEGVSLAPTFRGQALAERPLFFEHEGNAAVRLGSWKLVKRHGGEWELYDLAADRTETENLARAQPERARALLEQYSAWADRVGVRPWPVRRPAGYAPAAREYPATWKDLATDDR